jgi:TonB-dependent receptor-like protein
VTRSLASAAALLLVAAALAAQVDSTPRDTLARDSTASPAPQPDTTARDTTPRYLPTFPAAIPVGPLPRGARYSFTADSFVLSNVQTLSDLLAHIPGVYVARGGIYGAAEIVLYGGRGAAGLEIYWDGVPYLPLGRDSVFLDPARISLAPLERVEVIVLPASLRVYLVTARQRSTETASQVGVATGEVKTSNYRGAFLRRWRSGLGLSLVADYNDNQGIQETSSAPFSSVDLWLKAEYVPSARFGVAYQTLSSRWHRSEAPRIADWHPQRRDAMFRLFAAARDDGLGLRAQATFAQTSVSRDGVVPDRSLSQGALEVTNAWSRAHLGVAVRRLDDARPWQVEGAGGWSPFPALTLAGDARHAEYSRGRSGNHAHLAAGLILPLGLSLHGDLAWAHDLQAPLDSSDTGQRTVDVSGALRWDRRSVSLEVGGATRDPFTPIGFPMGITAADSSGPVRLSRTQRTRYFAAHGAVQLLPGLHLSGWYFDPLVRSGNDFEPPYHSRLSLTFYSKFWRVYRSGIFALRGELALESWSRGTAGLDSGGSLRILPGASVGEVNVEVRIAGVTIFWVQRNVTLQRVSYVPGLDYPRRYQFYGVRWLFTN